MFKELNEKAFAVGGSVRDEILGFKPNDYDYVIEASEEEFLSVFPNAKRVGNSFPVFLIEGNEVSLTRSESSNGNGYTDFILTGVGVSIEEDLARRDITIGSIAKNYSTGTLVDPYNGVDDIRNRIIRTVNENFVKEDPLRAIRIARFAAQFDFNIERKTAEIIKRDAKHLVNILPERIYLELKKNYERSNQPSIFFRVLYNLDILKYHFKPLYVATKIPAGPIKYHGSKSVFDHLLDSFDNAKWNGNSFSVAISSLTHDFGKILTDKALLPKHHGHEFRGLKLIEAFFKQHRFDAYTVKLAKLASKNHMKFHTLTEVKKPVKLIRFFKEIKNHFEDVVAVANNDHPLDSETIRILNTLERTFKETVIEVPKNLKGDQIVNFVENEYVKKYKILTKE